MAYKHGVYVSEIPTSLTVPSETDSAIQVVVGTAPVNLSKNLSEAVNRPVLAHRFSEAVEALGYSDDFGSYTLCQSMDMSFRQFSVSPVIFINVLDPAKHIKPGTESVSFFNGKGILEADGILIDESLTIDGLVVDEDYTAAFDDNGKVVLTSLNDNMPNGTPCEVRFNQIDPSAVTVSDVVGGISTATNTATGIEVISSIYSKLNLIPGALLAPGWSHTPLVALALETKARELSHVFKGIAIVDIDPSIRYDEVYEWKSQNSYTSEFMIDCYPKAVQGGKEYYLSSVLGALLGQVDSEYSGIPYVSPSNHAAKITGAVLSDGREVNFDIEQANYMNSLGVVTVLNMGGWKMWGNNMACYPTNTDPKDRFIPVRRMFNYIENTFISTYYQKVDSPMNRRLIESVVDSENIRLNGFVSIGALLGGAISFPRDRNPDTDLMNGTIRFMTQITPPTPAEYIENVFEFDATALEALFE